MKYMLDTNICIYAIKKKPENVLQKLQAIDEVFVSISEENASSIKIGE